MREGELLRRVWRLFAAPPVEPDPLAEAFAAMNRVGRRHGAARAELATADGARFPPARRARAARQPRPGVRLLPGGDDAALPRIWERYVVDDPGVYGFLPRLLVADAVAAAGGLAEGSAGPAPRALMVAVEAFVDPECGQRALSLMVDGLMELGASARLRRTFVKELR